MMRFLTMLRSRARRTEIYSQPSFWDDKARRFAGRAASMWPNEALNQIYRKEQFAFIHKVLPEVEGWRVLDIGCGTGDLCRYFASRGAEVVGVDFSAAALEQARTEPFEGIEYVQGSAFDLGKMGGFDLAATLGVMTVACKNKEDVDRLLAGVFQALKPGGCLLILEPLHRGALRRVLEMDGGEFRECLVRAGFGVRASEEIHFWPTRLLLAYVNWPRWVTEPLARWGAGFISSGRWKGMGDYQAILAERP